MNRRMYWLAIVAASASITMFQSSSALAQLRTVALSSQAAPGADEGANFSSFGGHFISLGVENFRGPVINDAGQVAFRADLTGTGVDATNNQGIWSEGSGNLALVGRTGSAAPGAPEGVNFARNSALELFEPVFNNAGKTAFYGGLSDGTVGLWSEGSGSLGLVARDGMQVSGAPEGANHSFGVLRDFFPDLPYLNDAGQTAFAANLTGSGVDNTNDYGVWSEGSGSLGLVARSGNPAPSTPEGVNFDSFFFQNGFNDAGHTAFIGYLTGSGVDPSNDTSIWSEASGSLALVARGGDPVPGTGEGVTFREFFYPVTLNNTGQTLFGGWLNGDGVDETNDEAYWLEEAGTFALVYRTGSPAPGTPEGVNFSVNLRPNAFFALNDAGQVAFRGHLTGTGVTTNNGLGIWSGSPDELELVARTGDQPPGTASGVRFSDLSRPALNNEGQVALWANIAGTGVGTSNNLGIWATDQTGALQLIARKGTLFEVAPGDARTISDLGFVTDSGNSDGRASAFNDLGQLVFWAKFTNNTQGVFVSDLVKIPISQPGDFDGDGDVDGRDFLAWQRGESPDPLSTTDLADWQENYGVTPSALLRNVTVPEPNTLSLLEIAVVTLCRGRKSFARSRAVVFPMAASAALTWVIFAEAHAATFEFDSTAATGDYRPAYVSGRVPTSVKGPVHGGTNINTLVGAETFYTQGYTGGNAVIANIEGGHIWSGHETLTHVQQIQNHPSALNEFDRHATWVGAVLGGRQGGANPGPYQEGLAPDAQLYSGNIISQWTGTRGSFAYGTVLDAVLYDQYRRAFSTGVNEFGRTADVINSSYGGDIGSNGSHSREIGLDGLANANPRTLFVVAAGNDGPGPDKVRNPAAMYNNMAVAALGANPPYDRPAWFSSGGPNDYQDPINGTKNDARQVVDIAAPGENLAAAYYGGETGSNGTTDNPAAPGPGPSGLPYGPIGGPDFYTRGQLGGTSLAAPTVAGGAALLYDAAYDVFADNADARDARVIKSVLMNSADKTIGWNNGQTAHPNGLGGVLTTQGLDNRVGTGRLNLDSAFYQFLDGTTDVADILSGNLGVVNDFGWDFGQVVDGTTNDYFFNSPFDAGSMFTATLSWFRDRTISATNTIFDASYDNLNLELWSVVDGVVDSLISESSSLYNESEHFSFALPFTGDYALRVRWQSEVFDRVADANQELYGLAWWAGAGLQAAAVPEPNTLLLLPFALAATIARRRTRPRHSSRVPQVAASLSFFIILATSARADIFQWEYIDPADPSQGKRQSATLAPDGVGIDALPYADLSFRNLTIAYLNGADLTGAYGLGTNLTNADLSQANLANAYLGFARLTNADVTGAEIRGANFGRVPTVGGTGISLAQLYSTASYQAHDLSGVDFLNHNLAGANFIDQDLSNASFALADLTDADFSGAEVRGAMFRSSDCVVGGAEPMACGPTGGTGQISLTQLYSTARYQNHELSGIGLENINLTAANFTGQNFTNASFTGADLTDADFTGAILYQANAPGANLTKANLSNVDFGWANLTGADFREANLANAKFVYYRPPYYCNSFICIASATFTDADLTGADARGASLSINNLSPFLNLSDKITTNLILPDGHIDGLVLDAGGRLVVRDYDGDPTRTNPYFGTPEPVPPIPITIDQHLSMAPGGTLRMVFEADAWDSTISLAPGIPVTLGGTLELTFAADVNPATQLGRTFDLFDWTGVELSGAFEVSSPYEWDLSNLYTTGEVMLIAVPEPCDVNLIFCSIAAIFVIRSGRRHVH